MRVVAMTTATIGVKVRISKIKYIYEIEALIISIIKNIID